jgi:hypothetical protein
MSRPDPTEASPKIVDTARPDRVAAAPPLEEPFPCPTCGQMLGPSVRVCVSCGEPVDFSKVGLNPPAVDLRSLSFTPARALKPVRFSWTIFAIVLMAWLLVAAASQRFLSPEHEQFFLAGIIFLSSSWVFYDASAQRIPHPLRWSIASILFWIVFFPWYLARRATPQAPCPVMDDGGWRVLRWVISIVAFLVLLSVALALLHGPFK